MSHNDDWQLVCVLQVDKDSEEISVSFLHPLESLRYPPTPEKYLVDDVLTLFDPRTAKGYTQTLTQVSKSSCN